MKKGWLKNTALVSVLATTLTACGGGGGGGASLVIDNTRNAIGSLNHALFNQAGSSTVTADSQIASSIEALAKISSSYKIQNSDREDAQLVVEFFTEWENFNSTLEGYKNSTEDRKKFDDYMNATFTDTDENRAVGLAGKTWRDAHKEIHGAYLILNKHRTLITKFANGETIYDDESLYLNFINDSELKSFEGLSDEEFDSKLRTKAETDTNLTKYNDDAIAEKNIEELDTIHNIVNSAVSTINNLSTSISSAISANKSLMSDQAVASGLVNYHDVEKSKNIITSVESGISVFEKILEDLEGSELTTVEKLNFYKSDDFKTAYKSYQYLKNDVKPIIEKIKNAGDNQVILDSSEVDVLATDGKDNYVSTMNDFINPKITELEAKYLQEKTVEKSRTYDEDAVVVEGTSETVEGDWATIYHGGGDEQRTLTTTTKRVSRVVTKKCTWNETTNLDGTKTKSTEVCVITNTVDTPYADKVTEVIETRAGDNPVVNTETLEPKVVSVETVGERYKDPPEGTYTDTSDLTTEVTEGSATTTTANRDVTVTTDHGDNTSTVVVTRYVDTVTTTPVTTKYYRTRHYTYTWKVDTTTTTTTTEQIKNTYKDGTTEVVDGTSTSVENVDTTSTEEYESKNILQEGMTTITDQVATVTDSGTELSRTTTTNAYTDNDKNLGTVTANMSTTVADHETAEYNSNRGLGMINAADAYARGWTGEGAVLGVIDTWQDTDHEKLDGKYLFYKDYDPYNGVVDETRQGHGTFVASIIAGKRDGDSLDENGRLTTGNYSTTTKYQNGEPYTEYNLTKNNDMHGVAFNSQLVGANVDRYSSGGISLNQAHNALHDFAKLKSPVAEGGEEMNIVAVNMSFNRPQLFYQGSDQTSTVTQLSDGTYSASEITSKITSNEGSGDARYWKIATDNDIILVNSAGNYGFDHAGDPGIWAVEENADGSLVLGGKMVIVGNWDGSNVSGNKAGHVCLNIDTINNVCNDNHRLSEFYILAPGTNITGAISDDRYTSGSGTSFAAPHVTGAFGVLNQMWPYMQGDKLVKLVMNTADKNLPGYNVNIHGQGLLDLNEATKPQGAVGLATSGRVDHPTVSLNNTYYSTGTALPSSLQNLKIMVLDDYDRNYYMDLGSSFVVKDKRKSSDVQMLSENNDTFLPHNQMYGSFTQGGNYDLDKNYNFGFYTGENGSGDYSVNVGKDFYLNKKFKLKTSLGHMSEQDTWLSNESDGVLAVGDNNDTTSASIGVAYQLGNNVLSLDYSKGKTDVNTTDGSLIKSFSDIETESYRLAYEIHKDTHTTFGWSFSLPSHITSGSMDLEVAESVNLDGTINYTNINSDLAQGTKEKNIGFFYNKAGEDELDASFNFTAEYRMDKSGVANNDGVEVGMNFVKKFAGNCKFLWMKNPKCFDKDGNMKADLFGKTVDNASKHGLVYDLETDKFIPIKK